MIVTLVVNKIKEFVQGLNKKAVLIDERRYFK